MEFLIDLIRLFSSSYLFSLAERTSRFVSSSSSLGCRRGEGNNEMYDLNQQLVIWITLQFEAYHKSRSWWTGKCCSLIFTFWRRRARLRVRRSGEKSRHFLKSIVCCLKFGSLKITWKCMLERIQYKTSLGYDKKWYFNVVDNYAELSQKVYLHRWLKIGKIVSILIRCQNLS